MWTNPQETANLVTFTKEILNGQLYFLYSVQIEKLSENVIVKLQEGSVSAADRSPIWWFIVSHWHNNIKIIDNNVAVDGNKA